MTQNAVCLITTVLPGSRIDVIAPELQENDQVELIILHHAPSTMDKPDSPATGQFASALDFLDSLPPISHSPEEWEQIERELRKDRDAWDR